MTRGLKILLVEDNPVDAALLRKVLPDSGSACFKIDCVTRISDAKAYLKSNNADIVILDLELPDSSGVDTLLVLREISPETPVVVLTGNENEATGIAAVQAGAQDYLIKGNTPGFYLSRVLQYAVERHRSEKKLHDSEQFLRSALDALSAHIAIVDESGAILAVNRAWRRFAVENDADTGKICEGNNYLAVCDNTWGDAYDRAAAFAAGIRAVLSGEQDRFEMENPCHGPDKKRWFLSRITPFPGDGPARAVIAHENISRQKRAEKALIESQDKFRSIVDNIGIGVALIDPDMRVLEVNEQIRNWFPETASSPPGYCYDTFSPMCGNDICDNCPAKQTLKDGKIHRAVQENPDGKQTRAYRIITSPIQNEEGRVIAAIQMMEDITETLSAERKLRQAQKMESLGTLAGGIAHDFNNILSAILGFTELSLDKAPKSGPLTDNLNEVYRAAIRATELVRQILTFSRKAEVQYGPLRIDTIIREAIKLLRSTLPSTIDIQLSTPKKPDYILADPTQIHQILMNLCTNAFHAMEAQGGVLNVKLEQVDLDPEFTRKNPGLTPGPHLKLSVSDTGCGITPELIEFIFDPYFTTKDQGEGTGLGLSLVHSIVKECGGDIFVQSAPGEGATFTLYFPSIKEAAVATHRDEKTLLTGGSERILVVDDEPSIVEILQHTLGNLGYRVTSEQDGARALALIEQAPNAFDLVLSDMTMPKMTGSQLAIQLKALYPEIPFILCTGYSKLITEEKAAELGIGALLIKPVSKIKLAVEIRRVLDETKKAREI